VSTSNQKGLRPSRRGLVRAAAGFTAAAGAGLGVSGVAEAVVEASKGSADKHAVEPFWGEHQGGIATPIQSHSYFAALDLRTGKRDDLIKTLRIWTSAAAQMTSGQAVASLVENPTIPSPDTGEAVGLPPGRLTITFGFGAGLFA